MNFSNLSPLAWCGIAVILFMVFSINIWLFSLLRNRKEDSNSSSWRQTLETLRNPFGKENDQLSELAQKVAQFKEKNDQNHLH